MEIVIDDKLFEVVDRPRDESSSPTKEDLERWYDEMSRTPRLISWTELPKQKPGVPG